MTLMAVPGLAYSDQGPRADAPLQARVMKMTCDHWPPYVNRDVDGFGPMVEIVTAALRRRGIRAEMDFLPWARAIRLTESGHYDLNICTWHSQDRFRKSHFSDPVLTNRLSFVKRRGRDIRWVGLQDLKEYVIAVERGAIYEPEFDNADYLTKRVANSMETSIKMVLAGRADLAPVDEGLVHYLLTMERPGDRRKLDFVIPPLSENPLHVISARKLPHSAALISAFNEGLQSIRREGLYERILARYAISDLRVVPD